MEKTITVYNVEPCYADRFADVTNQKGKVPLQTVALTSLEALKEYVREHTIEILLISSTVSKELVKEIPVGQVVVLADGEAVSTPEEYPSARKYQSTDSIIRGVLAHYYEQPKTAEYVIVGTKVKILGVYSPTGRCLKTPFSRTLGQQLEKNGRTLLVSTEKYLDFLRLAGEEMQSGLADVLYLHRQGNCSFARPNSMIYAWGNLDYIPLMRYPEDLGQIIREEVVELLTRIAGRSNYEMLVVDMGNVGRHVIPMMGAYDAVYMPVRNSCVSVAKPKEFKVYLGTSGKRGLPEKIQRVELPYHSGFGWRDTYLEQLVWDELGDYVRQFLKGKRWERE